MFRTVCFVVVAATLAADATAQSAPAPQPALSTPDPATFEIPDLNVPAKKLGDAGKYFFFHKAGTSFEQAYTDFAFCSRYILRGEQRSLPAFVPWHRTDAAKPISPMTNNYGLVGAFMIDILDGPIDRSVRQMRMMRCMLPRGYVRYRTSEALWKQVSVAEPSASIGLQAKIASGPTPPTPRTLP